jgi:hypothetical protein
VHVIDADHDEPTKRRCGVARPHLRVRRRAGGEEECRQKGAQVRHEAGLSPIGGGGSAVE